jgi:hypothetical protein
MKISQVVLYTWEIHLMPLAKLDSVTKMVPYTTDQKIFVIENLSSSCGLCVALERQYRREFSVHIAPPTITTYRIVMQLVETLSVYDERLNDTDKYRCDYVGKFG